MAATQDQPSKVAVFKVDINEKISEALGGMVGAAFSGGGTILFKGITVSKDDTFSGVNVLQNDKFLFLAGGSARVEPLMWRRFVNI